jgi:peroxiredoxin
MITLRHWVQSLRLVVPGVLSITLLLAGFTSMPAHATGVCSASVSPTDTLPTTYNNFDISVNNTGSTNIVWVDITVPDGFVYSGNASEWSVSNHPGGTTLTGRTINQGTSSNFPIGAIAGVIQTAPVNWHIQVSDDPDGANPTTCGGDIGTSISGFPPNDNVNGVPATEVSNITGESATVTWVSDYPTSSLLYYGTTGSYGNLSVYNPTIESSHSVTLTGLDGNTGYHFQAIGNDAQGNYAFSTDNTFLTADGPVHSHVPPSTSPAPPPPSAAPVVSSPSLTAPHSVVVGKGPGADIIPPTIVLNVVARGAYKDAPTFSGVASDDKAIKNVDYSTDSGKNWLPVDTLAVPGQSKVTFSFTPLLPQDNNYEVLARATDTGGNTTTTASQILVIDHLPPIVGGNIVSSGPQIIQPSSDGTIKALEGVDQKITLSAVGGPTRISLEATTTLTTKKDTKQYAQDFSLTLSPDTGLWSGILSFNQPGVYTLTVRATDGAGNKTTRVLNAVYVSSPGHTFDQTTHKPLASTVTVYYLEPESQTWVVWDGQAFGQSNPQKTDQRTGKTGTFSMLLPPGKYYLKAQAPGYQTLVGSIFTVAHPTPLAADLNLSPVHGLKFGKRYLSLPSLSVQHTSLSRDVSKNVNLSNLIGKQAPDFSLSDTTGATVNSVDLLGAPTLLSFESTWSPTTAEQLAALSKLQANHNLNVIPVAVQEQTGIVEAYTAMSGVNLRWLVDPDSTLSASYTVQSLPLHYFIDRTGIIRHVVVGVMSEQQMLTILTGL